MAVANTKSQTITDLDALPKRVVPSHKHAGLLKISSDSAEVVALDDNGSVYRMIRIPSNARIKELNVLNDAIAGATTYDLGVYQISERNAGVVVDADLFSSDINMVTARTLPLNALFEAGIDIINGDQRLWELLGLSSDSQIDYDICFTADVAGTGAGSIYVECVWSQ